MKTRFAQNRTFLVVLTVASAVVLLASGALLWRVTHTVSFPEPAPRPTFALPPELSLTTLAPSLDELAERYPELADLLRDPVLDSAYKDFVLAYQSDGIEGARKLALERGLINDRDEVRITLVIDSADNTEAVAAELERYGIIIEGTYRDLIDIAIPMMLIERFAQTTNAAEMFEQLTQLKHVVKLRLPVSTHVGAVLSGPEGVQVTGADAWHAAGFTGKGIKIGVLDLGFDGYRERLGKELPEQVVAESFVRRREPDEANQVHGTACAEVVHAMAPDAELYLAYYDGSDVSEGRAVEWLLEQGVQIITHSATSVVAPMDGSGPDAEQVEEVFARGVLWVNCAGNYAYGHYRGQFLDDNNNGFQEFPNGEEAMGIRFPPGEQGIVALNWDDWQNSDQDFDLFLYDSSSNLVASSRNAQTGQSGDLPFEVLTLTQPSEDTYYVVIKAANATRAVMFDLYVPDGEVQFPSAEHSLGSPADAEHLLSVGAVNWQTGELESFSSQGPTNDNRVKPDLSAPDAVTTASYAPEPFYGTSASAPHVAGAAALVLSAFPDFTPQQIVDYLLANALDQGAVGPDPVFGYGTLHLPEPNVAQEPTLTSPPPTEPVHGPTATKAGGGLLRTTVAAEATQTPTLVVRIPVATAPPVRVSRTETSLIIILALGATLCLGTIGAVGGIVLLLLLRRSRRAQPEVMPLPPIVVPRSTEGAHLLSEQGLDISLNLGDNSIGRSHESAIALTEDEQVSRHHATITWDGKLCRITDEGSTNGTFVNDKRLAAHVPYILNHGDRIRFGSRSSFIVQLPMI